MKCRMKWTRFLGFATALVGAAGCPPRRSPSPEQAQVEVAEFISEETPPGCRDRFTSTYDVSASFSGSEHTLAHDVSALNPGERAAEHAKAAEVYFKASVLYDDPNTPSTVKEAAYCDKRIAIAYEALLDYSQFGLKPDLTKYIHDNLTKSSLPRCKDSALKDIFRKRLGAMTPKYELDNSDDASGALKIIRTRERSKNGDVRDGVAIIYAKNDQQKEMTIELHFYVRRAELGYDFEPVEDSEDSDVVSLRNALNEVLGEAAKDIEGRCR